MKGPSFTVVVNYGDLEDRFDSLYYFMKYRLAESIKRAMEEAQREGRLKVFKLGDIVRPKKDKVSPLENGQQAFYLIEAEDVDGALGEVLNVKVRRGEEFAPGSYPTCKPGDLIFLRIRPYLRKVAIVPRKLEFESEVIDLSAKTICCSGEFYVFKLKDSLTIFTDFPTTNPELLMLYLWVYLRSNLFLFQILPQIVGATRPRISLKDLEEVMVPLLLNERAMKEIIAKAKSLSLKVKEARMSLRESLENLQRFLGPGIGLATTGSEMLAKMDEDLMELLFESGYLSRGFFMGLK
jgi:Trp operon repressor